MQLQIQHNTNTNTNTNTGTNINTSTNTNTNTNIQNQKSRVPPCYKRPHPSDEEACYTGEHLTSVTYMYAHVMQYGTWNSSVKSGRVGQAWNIRTSISGVVSQNVSYIWYISSRNIAQLKNSPILKVHCPRSRTEATHAIYKMQLRWGWHFVVGRTFFKR